MNAWDELVWLVIGPEGIFTTIALVVALDVMFPTNGGRKPSMSEILKKARAALKARADLNHDGKLDAKDVAAALAPLEAHAEAVTRNSALPWFAGVALAGAALGGWIVSLFSRC